MTSGATHGLRRNCTPNQCHIRGPSIFTQLAHHRKTWRAYQESMPGRCAAASSGLYAARHNPAVYYRPDRRTGSAAATSSRSARAGRAPSTGP